MASERLQLWAATYDGGPSHSERAILGRMLPLIEAAMDVVSYSDGDVPVTHVTNLRTALRDLGLVDE